MKKTDLRCPVCRCLVEIVDGQIIVARVPPRQYQHSAAYLRKQWEKHQQWSRNMNESSRRRQREERLRVWQAWMAKDPAERRRLRERDKRRRLYLVRRYGTAEGFVSMIPKRP